MMRFERLTVSLVVAVAGAAACSGTSGNTGGASTGGSTGMTTTGGASNGGGAGGGGNLGASGGTTGGTTGGSVQSGGSGGSGGSLSGAGGNGASGGAGGSVTSGGGGGMTGGLAGGGGTTSAGGSAGTTSATGGRSASGGTTARGGMGGMGMTAGSSGTANNGGAPPGADCTPPTTYPNLFVTLLGETQADSDAKVAAGWSQLFDPSGSNTVFYNGPGSDESYVEDIADNDVRTEGMSYGMMIAVQLDHQTEFDRLWTFVKNHMAQKNGAYAWHTSTSGSVLSSGGAPDGDEYFAAALVFAAKRWGATTGKYDYAAEAQPVLDYIRTQDFNKSSQIVAFIAGGNDTDGSYVLPAFYQTWACFDTANAAFWNGAVSAGRAFFQAAADSNGVIPDHSSFTGQSQGSAGSDALRCVANIMMDHNFFDADPWQTTYATEYGGYIKNHSNGSTAMLSCNGLLGFGLPSSTGTPFVQALWKAAIPTGTYRYYDGTLYLLGLLHVSGTFKLWY
ncbi:MAG TPA: glycosyl hydrolase family 8 [Polyangiaceae bacterium]|nr:glycosyl hydrolase family 8 [Polyangiaceae bacterium]